MKTTKWMSTLFALLLVMSFSKPAHAQLKISDSETSKLFITLDTVGTAQALQQSNVFDSKGTNLGKLSAGMQTAYGDLGFLGEFGKKQEIELYFDLYLASRNHPAQTYGNQGYLLMRDVPENLQSLSFLKPIFKHVDLKAGAFLVDFGDQQTWRSNNAKVQKNPLVGNFVIDPNFVSVGVQAMSKPGRFGWVGAITNGTNICVQIRKHYQGQPKQIAAALWGASAAQYRYKHVFVVEDDIDPSSYEQIDWALAYRMNAGRDGIVVFPGIFGSPIDPSTPLADRDVTQLGSGLWNRVLFDATRNWTFERRPEWDNERFPPTVRPAADDEARVRERWNELGLGDL